MAVRGAAESPAARRSTAIRSRCLRTAYEPANQLRWDSPAGPLAADGFLAEAYTGQQCQAQNFVRRPMVIDHLNQGAVQRYCDHLGSALEQAVGHRVRPHRRFVLLRQL